MREEESRIIEFIYKVKKKYGGTIHMDYVYMEETDSFDIWHNNYNLEYNDKEFSKFIGKNIREIFYDKNIFNIVFGYDHKKAKNYENICISKGISPGIINGGIKVNSIKDKQVLRV